MTIVQTTDLLDEITDWLADGKSLRAYCRQQGTPDRRTILRWMDEDAEFAAKCARARDIGTDLRFEAMDEEIEAEEDIQRAKLLFERRKWQLSKLLPKKYGDKIQQELTGPDGGAIAFKNMDDDQLEAEIKRRIAASGLA